MRCELREHDGTFLALGLYVYPHLGIQVAIGHYELWCPLFVYAKPRLVTKRLRRGKWEFIFSTASLGIGFTIGRSKYYDALVLMLGPHFVIRREREVHSEEPEWGEEWDELADDDWIDEDEWIEEDWL